MFLTKLQLTYYGRHTYFAHVFGCVLHYCSLKQPFALVVKANETSSPLVLVQCAMIEATSADSRTSRSITASQHHTQCVSADSLWLGSVIMNQGGDTFAFGLLDAQPNDVRLAEAIMYWKEKQQQHLKQAFYIWLYYLTECAIIFCPQCVFIHFITYLLLIFFCFVLCVIPVCLFFFVTVTR